MAAEATLLSKEYMHTATIVPPDTMVGMETITAGVPPMGAITRIIGTVTDGDSASDLVLGLTGIMAFRTDMVLGGALRTPTPTPIIILIMFLAAAHTRTSGVATRPPRTLRRTPTATPHRNISPLQRRKIPPATTI